MNSTQTVETYEVREVVSEMYERGATPGEISWRIATARSSRGEPVRLIDLKQVSAHLDILICLGEARRRLFDGRTYYSAAKRS